MMQVRTGPCQGRSRGFSLVEILVALAVFSIVAGIVLSVFTYFGRGTNTESGAIEMQQAARVTLEELARNVQQVGYNIDRSDAFNPTHWQRDLVFAGSHILAFNADIDPSIGPLAPSQTIGFPGETYRGEGASATTSGAETYVYTLDADGDGEITQADRSRAQAGSFNPAAETENPLDFALFRKVYGYDGSGYGGRPIPVSADLFTNATQDARYPDGTTPDALFTYWLTEDLNGNGTLEDAECVVDPCPPTTPRSPKLYLWGDTNFDGKLQETEKAALRGMPVGSPVWSRNRLAAGGAYRSSTLTADTSSSVLKVADASRFAPGEYVQLGAGASTETLVVETIDATTNEITTGTDPARTHLTGDPVVVLPQTLLRAVRTVQMNFDAIMPTPDTRGGVAAAGRMGHAGTRGLDYRVQPFEKSVELVNLQTTALLGAIPTAPPACPLTIVGQCGASAITELPIYVPAATATTLTFVVNDPSGAPMKGVPVDFTQSTPGTGALSVKTVKTMADGKATVRYTTTGAIGDDVVTATATCVNSSQQLVRFRSHVDVHTSRLGVDLSSDCLSTINSRVSSPGTGFSLSVRNARGLVANSRVRLSLALDPNRLPSASGTAGLEGELFVGARSAGTTDSSGATRPVQEDTGSSGVLTGRVALNRDTPQTGARLDLLATPLGDLCTPDGAPVTAPVTFYALTLDSETPRVGCTEIDPCTIAAGSRPPMLAARLAVAGQAAPNATVRFTKIDTHAGGGSSILMPGSSVATDVSGVAHVQVANNASSTITSGNPLTTTVDATSTGEPSTCSRADIVLASPRSQFRFEGAAGECVGDVQQAWLSRLGTSGDRLCLHLKNANAQTGCPIRPAGIAITVFKADGVTPDNVYRIERIEGGAVDASPSCSTTGRVTLFTSACNRNNYLPNGQRWDFTGGQGCATAPAAASPGQYFVFNVIDFTANLAGTGRRVDVTVTYRCEGVCPPASVPVQRTFRLRAP